MNDNFLNEQVKLIRTASSLTTKELADIIGVTEQSIKNIEMKRTKTSGAILALMVEKLKVNPVWLMTGEGHIFLNWTTDQKTLDAFEHLYHVAGSDITDHFDKPVENQGSARALSLDDLSESLTEDIMEHNRIRDSGTGFLEEDEVTDSSNQKPLVNLNNTSVEDTLSPLDIYQRIAEIKQPKFCRPDEDDRKIKVRPGVYLEPAENKRAPSAHILENANTENSNRKPVSDLDKPAENSSTQPVAHLDGDNSNTTPVSHLTDNFVLVPRYDVNASAGHGSVIHSEQIVDHLAFKREWVRKDLGLNPDKLALINVVGDSMEPAILSNDLLLVDLANNTLSDDAIYVLSVNGSLLVKRIQRMLNGSVAIKSDNPIYDNQTLQESELSDLRVLGRVVWFGRSM